MHGVPSLPACAALVSTGEVRIRGSIPTDARQQNPKPESSNPEPSSQRLRTTLQCGSPVVFS